MLYLHTLDHTRIAMSLFQTYYTDNSRLLHFLWVTVYFNHEFLLIYTKKWMGSENVKVREFLIVNFLPLKANKDANHGE